MPKNNVVGVELTGKKVILSSKYYKGTDEQRTFLCKDGFGCSPGLLGTAVFGEFMVDGEKARVDRYEIEKVLD